MWRRALQDGRGSARAFEKAIGQAQHLLGMTHWGPVFTVDLYPLQARARRALTGLDRDGDVEIDVDAAWLEHVPVVVVPLLEGTLVEEGGALMLGWREGAVAPFFISA